MMWTVRRSTPWRFTAATAKTHIVLAYAGAYTVAFACKRCGGIMDMLGDCAKCGRGARAQASYPVLDSESLRHSLAAVMGKYDAKTAEERSRSLSEAFERFSPAVAEACTTWDQVQHQGKGQDHVQQILIRATEIALHQDQLWAAMLEAHRLQPPGCYRAQDA